MHPKAAQIVWRNGIYKRTPIMIIGMKAKTKVKSNAVIKNSPSFAIHAYIVSETVTNAVAAKAAVTIFGSYLEVIAPSMYAIERVKNKRRT